MTTFYFNSKTKEYPRYRGDLELLGWVHGTPLPPNWVEVTVEELPPLAADDNWQMNEPSQSDDGNWVATHRIWKITQEELEEAQRIRDLAAQMNLDNLPPR